jgi:hypothetical protein
VVPLALTVYGLIAFGLLHNFFELRYVIGRYCLRWSRPVAILAVTTLPLFVARRLLMPGPLGSLLEIALAYGLIIGTICLSSWSAPQRLLLIVPALLAAALSITNQEMHFVALAHLHNVLPLIFLWWWSESLPSGPARTVFRAVQVGWTLVLPLFILIGAADAPIGPLMSHGAVLAGDWLTFAQAYTPPLWSDGAVAVRFLTAFAFMQTMHYVVWCGFIPIVGRDENATIERALEQARLPGTRTIAGMVVVVAAALGLLLLADYWEGRHLYSALASFHAYLELPVILIVIAAGRQSFVGGGKW